MVSSAPESAPAVASPRAPRPLVAVTGRRLALGRVTRWLEPALAVPTYYVDALARAGGVGAVLIPEPLDEAGAGALLGGFDGLVLTGGGDVDPALYGAEPAPETYGCDEIDDRFEIALVRAALTAGVPTLAICRGLQILNVALGGTLDQHISGQPGLLMHGIPNGGGGSDVEAAIVPGSRLYAAAGERLVGRCHHHQAVATVAPGLHIVAQAADGVVEGLEPDPGVAPGWCVAVQWHPEDTAANDPGQQRLFDALVAEARVDGPRVSSVAR